MPTDKSQGSQQQQPPPPLPVSSLSSPSTNRPSSTRRITSRPASSTESSPPIHSRFLTQGSLITTPDNIHAVNPFNDLNDNGKGGGGHKVADDLNNNEPSVPNKSLSSGISDSVSNTLSNPDKEVSV